MTPLLFPYGLHNALLAPHASVRANRHYVKYSWGHGVDSCPRLRCVCGSRAVGGGRVSPSLVPAHHPPRHRPPRDPCVFPRARCCAGRARLRGRAFFGCYAPVPHPKGVLLLPRGGHAPPRGGAFMRGGRWGAYPPAPHSRTRLGFRLWPPLALCLRRDHRRWVRCTHFRAPSAESACGVCTFDGQVRACAH